MKKGITALYIFLIAFVLAAVGFAAVRLRDEAAVRRRLESVRDEYVELDGAPDGVYSGSCYSAVASARVLVTVRDGRLADVRLVEHATERGYAAEVLPAVMLAEQTVQVDAVTGATVSSEVIVKAAQRALSAARRSCPYNSGPDAEAQTA